MELDEFKALEAKAVLGFYFDVENGIILLRERREEAGGDYVPMLLDGAILITEPWVVDYMMWVLNHCLERLDNPIEFRQAMENWVEVWKLLRPAIQAVTRLRMAEVPLTEISDYMQKNYPYLWVTGKHDIKGLSEQDKGTLNELLEKFE